MFIPCQQRRKQESFREALKMFIITQAFHNIFITVLISRNDYQVYCVKGKQHEFKIKIMVQKNYYKEPYL